MKNTEIRLFVGQEITDPAERRLIKRLLFDLEQHGVRGVLYANFLPEARQERQIDLLVRADTRTAHVEIKGLSADYPVHGRKDGQWTQLLPNGTERPIANGGRQALLGTYTISDAMRGLARRGTGMDPDLDFKRHIDTIVTMWETIPEGSDIEAPLHVTVLGYQDLVERLIQPDPGRIVPWSDKEWDEFVLHHSLYQPEDVSLAEQHRRASLETITDYRLSARVDFSDGVNPFVDLGAVGVDGAQTSIDGIDHMVAGGRTVAIIGPSGCGKSHLAKQLAVRHCDQDRLVIWVRAGEFEGMLSRSLARAMGPYSEKSWYDLISTAEECGVATSVFVDGLNECPAGRRAELLRQLKAFSFRHPAGVLVTSTSDEGLAGTHNARVIHPNEAGKETRLAILAAHGAGRPERISNQFRTPYELAIAAECESDLPDNATVAELHDAYIRHHAPTEGERTGLRALATRLHSKLRTSLPQLEAASVLSDHRLGITGQVVDDLMASHLLEIGRHRVRFRHELIGQFLTAEAIVRTAPTGRFLGSLLSLPANEPLTRTALEIECDGRRIWDAISVLWDSRLMFCALTGDYGLEAAALACEDIRDVLLAGIAAADPEKIAFEGIEEGTLEGVEQGLGRWVGHRQWSGAEKAMLSAAGMGLAIGMFFDEVCELIDRTDQLCLHQVRILETAGISNPGTAVVAATYGPVGRAGERGLAATGIAGGFTQASQEARFGTVPKRSGLASRLVEGAGRFSWGRYHLALACAAPHIPEDRAVFAYLLQSAWEAGGFHLQLQSMHAAADFGLFGGAEDPNRLEIIDVLSSLNPSSWALKDSLMEALAQFGEIESGTTPGQLRDHIRETISNPECEASRRSACGMVSMRFENPDIFGPFYEVIEELTKPEKARLYTMAALGSDPDSFLLYATLEELCELVPIGDEKLDNDAKAAFESFLGGPPEDAVMPNEAANACRVAIRGWAKFESSLPLDIANATPAQKNWRLLAGLLLCHERDDAAVDTEKTWRRLLAEPGETVATLAGLESTNNRVRRDAQSQVPVHRTDIAQLTEDYPEQMRGLFEWALENFAEIPAYPFFLSGEAATFVISVLGDIGDENTPQALDIFIDDPEIGSIAVKAIRKINHRTAP